MALVVAAGIGLTLRDPTPLGMFLIKEDPLEVADAALVFSGDVGYERTLEAARLYYAGYAPYLVFSGSGGPGDSGHSMAQVAARHGVPARALLVVEQGTSTYGNVLGVRGLLAQHSVLRLILVTSPYHQRRAYLVARHLLPGVTLVNHPALSNRWTARAWWREPNSRWIVLDEYVKLAGYLLMGRI